MSDEEETEETLGAKANRLFRAELDKDFKQLFDDNICTLPVLGVYQQIRLLRKLATKDDIMACDNSSIGR